MSQLILPLVNRQFYLDSMVSANREAVDGIAARYRSPIQKWSGLTGVDADVISSFIFIESQGNPKSVGGVALGLMQIDITSATTGIYLARKAGLLTPAWEASLTAQLGPARMAAIRRMANQTPTKGSLLTAKELLAVETNIACGTTLLRYLMQKHTVDGIVRLDRVVFNYNKGINAIVPSGSPDQVYAQLARRNVTTATYITKLVGRNGVLTDLKTAA